MTKSIKDLVSTVIGDKAAWRRYKARTRELPTPYRTAIDALERYLMYAGTGGSGQRVFDDLIDLFERSAADETPIRDIVGDDPVEFIDVFIRNYAQDQWIVRERDRLNDAIARAAGEDVEPGEGAT